MGVDLHPAILNSVSPEGLGDKPDSGVLKFYDLARTPHSGASFRVTGMGRIHMWKSVAIPVALAVASAAAPAQAATLVQVSTTNSAGWSIITPGSTTPTPAQSTTRNTAWQNASWISTSRSGTANVPPGNYTYIYSLSSLPGFGVLTGLAYTDNRLLRIFVNNDPNKGFTLPSLPSVGEFEYVDSANRQYFGRQISLDFSQYGPISSIHFLTNNDGTGNNPAAFSFAGQVPAVPEPGTWMLMILGLGAVGFAMRRRQSVSARLQFA